MNFIISSCIVILCIYIFIKKEENDMRPTRESREDDAFTLSYHDKHGNCRLRSTGQRVILSTEKYSPNKYNDIHTTSRFVYLDPATFKVIAREKSHVDYYIETNIQKAKESGYEYCYLPRKYWNKFHILRLSDMKILVYNFLNMSDGEEESIYITEKEYFNLVNNEKVFRFF